MKVEEEREWCMFSCGFQQPLVSFHYGGVFLFPSLISLRKVSLVRLFQCGFATSVTVDQITVLNIPYRKHLIQQPQVKWIKTASC